MINIKFRIIVTDGKGKNGQEASILSEIFYFLSWIEDIWYPLYCSTSLFMPLVF